MTSPTGPFFRRGVTKFVFCPAVADLAAPTRSEITAGTEMKGITGVSGFQITRSFVDTPDLDSDFTSNIPGERKADNSSLTFKDKRNSESQDIRDATADGTEGVMLYMPYGDTPGQRLESWPCTAAGPNDVVSLDGFATFQVAFATPDPPVQNAVVPA